MDKINQLKWLRAIGVEYYFSESNKRQKILMNHYTQNKKDPKHSTTTKPLSGISDSEKSSVNSSLLNVPYRDTREGLNTELILKSPIGGEKQSTEFAKDSTRSPIELARFLADSANDLEKLRELVSNFDGCDLKKLANNTVFADGNPKSSIMLIGEAPGSNEDTEGIPFCGESGKLLDNILSSINISRKHNAYITNTVFWRPPANRQPTQMEIDICRPFVEKHIALINPKCIILVGNVAATSLLGTNAGISKIKQVYYPYINQYLTTPIQTTAIFHPAYLLRQPMQKKTMWYDLLKIEEFLLKLM